MFRIILPRFIFRVERWKWNKEYRIYVSNMGHFMDEHKKIIPVKINDLSDFQAKLALSLLIEAVAGRLVFGSGDIACMADLAVSADIINTFTGTFGVYCHNTPFIFLDF